MAPPRPRRSPIRSRAISSRSLIRRRAISPQQPYPPQYGAAPNQADPSQAPMQLGPGGAPLPPREVTGTVRPNTVATLRRGSARDRQIRAPPQFKRQIVPFQSAEPAGTLVIDTANTYLYLVLGNGQAMRYGIGVGREGFTWAGAERVSRMAEWPDWHPPAEMIERQPYLPRFMAGGEGNPLGARALYLGKTLYRIHGTNQPSTIGKYVSSGCHPADQRRHRGSLQPRAGRHPRGGAAGSPPAQASNRPAARARASAAAVSCQRTTREMPG
jgi:lipoprotein-anchoring transpeptidase ErfK/SrfK